jgi:hypothetical protein
MKHRLPAYLFFQRRFLASSRRMSAVQDSRAATDAHQSPPRSNAWPVRRAANRTPYSKTPGTPICW